MTKCWFAPIAGILVLSGCDGSSRYAASCSVPLAGCRTPGEGWHNLYRNQITMAEDGKLKWNGVEVSRERLRDYLAKVPALNPYPATVLVVDADADCDMVHTVRKDVDDALNCAESQRCGEGSGEWNSPPQVRYNSAAAIKLEQLADSVANQVSPR